MEDAGVGFEREERERRVCEGGCDVGVGFLWPTPHSPGLGLGRKPRAISALTHMELAIFYLTYMSC